MDWNDEVEYALGPYKKFCFAFGIWPSENRITSALKLLFYCVVVLSTVGIFVQRGITLGNCGTVQEIADSFNVSLSSIQIGAKLIIIYVFYEKYLRIIESAIEDWSLPSNKKSKAIMMKYARVGRIVFNAQIFLGLFTAVPMILGDLPATKEVFIELDNSTSIVRTIPLAPNCWVGETTSQVAYYLHWTSLVVYIICVAFATVACNLTVYGLGIHVYTEFEVLYHSLEELQPTMTFKEQRQCVSKLIQQHNRALDVANLLEDASNMVILSEVSAIMIVGCIAGTLFLLAMQSGDRAILSAMAGRLFLVFVQLFIFCFLGEKLSQQADKIQEGVYNNILWYELSPHISQDLKLVMVRSNCPYSLTAGKFYLMNLISFKEVVKSMFSFFSVLRLMLQNDN